MRSADRRPRQRLSPDDRRATILDAAVEAFRGAPYAEVSVAGIAAAAGTSEALVHRYFGSKPGLYVEVIRRGVSILAERQRAALAALPPNSSTRDRVRVPLFTYLDYIAEHPTAWAAPFTVAGNDPPAALALRHEVRAAYVGHLRDMLPTRTDRRHEYTLHGYLGFLEAACLHWVQEGCPDDQRHALVDAALGALEGALGDWG